MKKFLFTTSIVLLLSLFSCNNEDNYAKVKVINETNFMNDVYDGFNSNSNYLGKVGANQTETFEINIGDIDSMDRYQIYAEPSESGNGSGEIYYVNLKSSATVTIVIN